MTPLWTSDEILAAIGGQVARPFIASGVNFDSRLINSGDLFFALKSDNNDGHNFVANAVAGGASGVIVNHISDELKLLSAATLLVDYPVFDALLKLAIAARKRCPASRVAVTGSAGKTSTRELLRLALTQVGATHASEMNFNNHIGVPLSLVRMPKSSQFAVFELGMSRSGEIAELSELVKPHIAIITNIAQAHLQFFQGTAEIAKAKAEIFIGTSGAAILNIDDEYSLANSARAKGLEIISFGENKQAGAHLINIEMLGNISIITANIMGKILSYRLQTLGRHMAINSLAALAAVSLLGGDLEAAKAGLESFYPLKGRGQQHYIRLPNCVGQITIIDDSYNANPASMRAAFATLAANGQGQRTIAVLADMYELGDNSANLHAVLAGDIIKANISLVITYGDHMRFLSDNLKGKISAIHGDSLADICGIVKNIIRDGDIILIKGSNSTNIASVVTSLLSLSGGGPCS